MRRTIELKHVGPRGHVQRLFEELIDRLQEKLQRVSQDAASVHAVFEENGSHKLYRTSLTCHVPGHLVAAHEEGRDAGLTIRKAFAELERQLDKQKAILRHEHQVRRSKQTRRSTVLGWIAGMALLWSAGPSLAEDGAASPKAVEAMRLLESQDAYQREVGFIRLEALREPATIPTIAGYLTHKDPDVRAYSLRALGAIQGASSVPILLQALLRDRHPYVRRAALLALEPFEPTDPAILPAFLRALRDRKPEVRMTAVDIVSRVDAAQAKEAILVRNKRERDRDVRRVLALAMKRIAK